MNLSTPGIEFLVRDNHTTVWALDSALRAEAAERPPGLAFGRA